MKKGILLVPVAGAVAAFVALGVMSIKTWDWKNATQGDTINYCLLIGQTDHNDSAARTGGIREKLGTRPTKHETNANIETPKQGKLKFLDANDKLIKQYTVNELESKVCISDSGATWDQQTAINISNTWYAKYPNKLTMMVSNNDGMAEGALFSLSRPDGMPIFGYDSNESTLKLIQKNRITGTINSNAPAQAAALNILARRVIDGVYTGDEANIYNTLFKGFTGKVVKLDDKGNEVEDVEATKKFNVPGDGNFVEQNKFMTDILGETSISFTYKPYCHALLCSSNAVTNKNANDFLKSAKEQASKVHTIKTPAEGGKKYDFFQSCYSLTDTYLNSTMNPLIDEFKAQFGISIDMVSGNGNDEEPLVTSIKTKGKKNAYLINMVKTVNAQQYINAIKDLLGEEEYKKTPIIFYNRQPTHEDNSIDPTWLMKETNGGNPYVFYVGFDAVGGAELQGTMIQDWLKEQVGAAKVEVVDE